MALARSDEVYDFRSITFQFSMKTLSKMAFTYVHMYICIYKIFIYFSFCTTLICSLQLYF